jgi:hypothetical protein
VAPLSAAAGAEVVGAAGAAVVVVPVCWANIETAKIRLAAINKIVRFMIYLSSGLDLGSV